MTNQAPPAVHGVASAPRHIATFALTFLALGAAQVATYVLHHQGQTLRVGFLAGLWALCAAVLVMGMRKPVTSQLVWNGVNWRWSGAEPTAQCDVTVRLDLNRFVLVAVYVNRQFKVWLWFEAKQQPLQWLALRRALFAESRSH